MKVFMKRNPVGRKGALLREERNGGGVEETRCFSPTEMPLGDERLEGKETEGGVGWRGTFWGNLHILRNISGRLG